WALSAARHAARRGCARAAARAHRPAGRARGSRARAHGPQAAGRPPGGAVRIVGGQFRGRRLAAPTFEGTRPTPDRVREAIFNILAHAVPAFQLEGARVLDLFAGTGALGLEALSRGAAFCLFVDERAEARALMRRNIEAFGLAGITKVFRRDATELGPAGRKGGFTLAFLDPPYGQGLAQRAL